ncbi:hypothetical protein BSKO_07104 [Bryopsis sp. KO-2023]|nr:hypothetical protein BSKO_07104 [Bryopsis sp. KO-2023]
MYSAVSCAARRVLVSSKAYLSPRPTRAFSSVAGRTSRPTLFAPNRKHGERCGTSFRTFASLAESIETKIAENKVVVYGKSWCGFSQDVEILLRGLEVDYQSIELDNIPEGMDLQDALYDLTGIRTVPQVFVGGKFIGGCDETVSAYKTGELKTMFEEIGVASKL